MQIIREGLGLIYYYVTTVLQDMKLVKTNLKNVPTLDLKVPLL